MNYMTLSNREIKELLLIRIRDLCKYMITLVILSFVYKAILHRFFPQVAYADLLSAIGAFVVFYLGYILYLNRNYLSEIVSKKKKVYKGVLSDKTIAHGRSSDNRYSFNMDGYIFYVGEEIFHAFEKGDCLEFHISPSTKHLFKVERVK